jgi:hypothetical protein
MILEKHIPKSILKHSDDAIRRQRSEEADLERLQSAIKSSESQFARSFGRHMTGQQMGQCVRLAHAFAVREGSGNARCDYEGVYSPQFGSKTISEAVLMAGDYIAQCRRAVDRDVGMRLPSAWLLLADALIFDMGTETAGKHYTQSIMRDRMSEDGSRKRAIRVIGACAVAIESVEEKRA